MNIKMLKDYIKDCEVLGVVPNWYDLKERNTIIKKLQSLKIEFVKS